MSKDKGIFEPQEGFASGPTSSKSPFSVDETPNNPFASGGDAKSPFAMDDGPSAAKPEAGKSSEPFASGVGKSPFNYEPPVAGFGGSPFEGTPSPAAAKDSPFGSDDASKKDEPKASSAPFGDPAPASAAPAAPAPAPAPASASPVAAVASPAATPAPVSSPASVSSESDSSSIRQLELRAIFGVDRELSEGEILQRSRSLAGIRNLARVSEADAAAIDTVKRTLGGLGFGDGQVRLVVGNSPVEFIREGRVLLAVQNDGSFAPGVRETLILVARELARM